MVIYGPCSCRVWKPFIILETLLQSNSQTTKNVNFYSRINHDKQKAEYFISWGGLETCIVVGRHLLLSVRGRESVVLLFQPQFCWSQQGSRATPARCTAPCTAERGLAILCVCAGSTPRPPPAMDSFPCSPGLRLQPQRGDGYVGAGIVTGL